MSTKIKNTLYINPTYLINYYNFYIYKKKKSNTGYIFLKYPLFLSHFNIKTKMERDVRNKSWFFGPFLSIKRREEKVIYVKTCDLIFDLTTFCVEF